MNLPQDASESLLKCLANSNFDFSVKHDIEFYIFFESWQDLENARAAVSKLYPNHQIMLPDEEDPLANQFPIQIAVKFYDFLDYEFVTKTMGAISREMLPHKGVCDSWGVIRG